MKYLIILFAMVFSLADVFGQNKSAIEVKLHIIESKNAAGKKIAALGVDVINHTDKDIYIPDFFHFAAYSGIHFYQKKDNEWQEFNLITQIFYRLGSNDALNSNGHYNSSPVLYRDNSITSNLSHHIFNIRNSQDSILKVYCKGKPELCNRLRENMPLFLSKGEILNNFIAYSLDYLLKNPAVYRIAFNSEKRDKRFHYKDSILNEKGRPVFNFPNDIFKYHRIAPHTLISNAIIYSTL